MGLECGSDLSVAMIGALRPLPHWRTYALVASTYLRAPCPGYTIK